MKQGPRNMFSTRAHFEPDTQLNNYNEKTKPNLSKRRRLKKLVKSLTEFADEISFTGLKYAFGSVKDHYVIRIIWLCVFLTCLVFGMYLFRPIWRSYHNGDTIIVINQDQLDELEYPTITLCNINKWRRSVVGGGSENFLQIMGGSRNSEDVGGPACSAPKLHEKYSDLDENKVGVIYSNTTSLVEKFGFFTYLFTSHSAYQSVMWCKFKGKKLTARQCYSSFINTVIFDGLCFMFNPSDKTRFLTVSNDQINDRSESERDPMFPKQVSGLVNYIARTTGYIDSVELLLNVQQFEYCASGDSDGVGFEMQVHSPQPELQPVIMRLNSGNIRLSPGKEVIASIKKVKHIRQTETFGRCKQMTTYNYHSGTSTYHRATCINDCITTRIQAECRCLPVFAPVEAHNAMLRNASWLGYAVLDKICLSIAQSRCVRVLVTSDITRYCSKCKTACEETRYELHVTQNDFPAHNSFSLFNRFKYPRIKYGVLRKLTQGDRQFHIALNFTENIDPWSRRAPPSNFKNIDEVRQNLVLLRLQYYEMNVETIIEKLATTFPDMVSQFGGLLGLFIGASIISFVEIIYWIIVCCRSACTLED